MKNCRKVYSNLLAQNVYVRDCCPTLDSPLERPEPTYLSLDEVVTGSGVEIFEKIEEYPITPEYVDSFVEGSDYRTNLAESAVQSAQRASSRVNLGDIRTAQDILSKNPDVVNSLYIQLLSKFKQDKQDSTKDSPSNANKEANDNIDKEEN